MGFIVVSPFSFVDVIIDQMEKIITYKEVKMQQLEDTQKELQDKLNKMENPRTIHKSVKSTING